MFEGATLLHAVSAPLKGGCRSLTKRQAGAVERCSRWWGFWRGGAKVSESTRVALAALCDGATNCISSAMLSSGPSVQSEISQRR